MNNEILYFTAKWCSPCKQLRPRVEKMVAERDLTLTIVDIDESPEIAAKHDVLTVPTISVGGVSLSGEAVRPASLKHTLDSVRDA